MIKTRTISLPLLLLGFIHLMVLSAGFLAPYDYASQNRMLPFAPPTRIHFVDTHGEWHFRPFVYGLVDQPGNFGSYSEDLDHVYPLRFFVHGDEYKLIGSVTSHLHLLGV